MKIRDFEEFRTSGMMALINASVLHPRGYALTFNYENDKLIGWSLQGDGSEPWGFADWSEEFKKVQGLLSGDHGIYDRVKKYEIWDTDVGIGLYSGKSESEVRALMRILVEAGHDESICLLVDGKEYTGKELKQWVEESPS